METLAGSQYQAMMYWNPIGWSFLLGGFLFGVIVAWLRAGEILWIGSYVAMLAGFMLLTANLSHTLWRIRQKNKVIHRRLFDRSAKRSVV